ncbi:oxidoreductase [Heyndrickxia shackletonii]|uniref:Oxidoreductase n=1 Tax=Heyndrickxia shackletonii TaxID=157838 RepID=A0A0Q3TE67_9BACI|nr:DoxX family protein [Heyndrickxia shackletonii]KQL52358.1 oxidoreductase [Heyndrickxia shackletonii]NEY99083.1 DoxX family protein [Heyndrickxia shackletonii]
MSALASLGLLLIRVILGASFAAHGSQKLFGWFGGHGLAGTGGFFESIGITPGKTMAFLAGLGELVGGLLFAFGLLTPIGAILIALTMIVAIAKVHGPNGWIKPNGYEYNLLLIVVAIGVALVGPGTYAIDALIF